MGAAERSGFYLRDLPVWPESGALLWVRVAAPSVALAALLVPVVGAIRARRFDERPVELSLPFDRGAYAVFEGDNGRCSPLMSYHLGSAVHGSSGVNRFMRYAVDLTRLSPWGNDAFGVLPRSCEAYPVFREMVLSPCSGTVREVVDQWPNEVPWNGKAPCNLGKSGWTSQPHLHVQAMKIDPQSFWKGEGLPILFDGRNPLKNALFFR